MNVLSDTVEMVSVDDLTIHPNNPRIGELEPIKESIRVNGFFGALVVQKSTRHVLVGNHRLMAARDLGADEVPVLWVDVDDAEAVKILLADNRTSDLGIYDAEQLVGLLQALDDTEGTGYESRDIDELLAKLGGDDVDAALEEAPAVPDVARSLRGDLWLLGPHRVLCGDATDAVDLSVLMGDESAGMIFTDPPWNVAIGLDSNPRHQQREGLVNDDLTDLEFEDFLDKSGALMLANCTGDLYCVLGASEWPTLDRALRSAGFHWSATIVWVKDQFVLGRAKYHRRYEPIWYGWPKRGKSSYLGGRAQDDVWEFARPRRSVEHPTMKPVALVQKAIRNSSETGHVVLDPFLGSGSTLIAANELGRRCFGLEIDPRYVDVTCTRYEQLTGIKPVLERTGAPVSFL